MQGGVRRVVVFFSNADQDFMIHGPGVQFMGSSTPPPVIISFSSPAKFFLLNGSTKEYYLDFHLSVISHCAKNNPKLTGANQ
jgi:hypothetical protein